MDELWYWILISVVITCHELGHATAAWCMGIRVKKVCLFFDPGFHLLSTGNRFKVEFCLGWLPLGGYCSLATSLDGVPPEQTADRCEAWKRCILDIAGVSTNFVLRPVQAFRQEGIKRQSPHGSGRHRLPHPAGAQWVLAGGVRHQLVQIGIAGA